MSNESTRRENLAPQRQRGKERPDSEHDQEREGPPRVGTTDRPYTIVLEPVAEDRDERTRRRADQRKRSYTHAKECREYAIRAVEVHVWSFSSRWSRRRSIGSDRAASTKGATAASPKSRTTSPTAIAASSATAGS